MAAARLLGETRERPAALQREEAQQVLGQGQQVAAARAATAAKRDLHDVEAVEQILAEGARRDAASRSRLVEARMRTSADAGLRVSPTRS